MPYTAPADKANGSTLTPAEFNALADAAEQSVTGVEALPAELPIAFSDETTPLTAGLVFTGGAGYGMTPKAVLVDLTTAATSGTFELDVLVDGVSMFNTRPTIDVGDTSSYTAGVPLVIKPAFTIPFNARITVSIINAAVGAKGGKVWLLGTRPIVAPTSNDNLGLRPTVTTQPVSTTIVSGNTATFTAAATGATSAQWQHNGTGTFANIAAATSLTTYTTPVLTGAESGRQYRVIYTNASGSTTSSAATVTVTTVPIITSQPVSTTVVIGATATFNATATGAVSAQWRKNAVNIAGATSLTTYTTPVTIAGDNGAVYDVIYTNSFGSTTSSGATLTVATVVDDFNRVDSATTLGTSTSGHVWTAHTGTWGISGNQAYLTTTGTHNVATVAAALSDGTVKVTIAAQQDAGLCFRFVDINNYWLTSNSQVFECTAGVFTDRGTFTNAIGSGDVVSVVLSGTSISVRRNGTQVTAVTSSVHQTATRHGLRIGTGNATARYDDFSVV